MMTATATRPTINCNASPFIPNQEEGWSIKSHRQFGQFEWDASIFKTYLDEKQLEGRSIKGTELKVRLPYTKTLNANFLDFLLDFLKENPFEIPETFKPVGDAFYQCNIFWGTIYVNPHGREFVRTLLVFKDGKCQGSYLPVDHGFGGCEMAIVLE